MRICFKLFVAPIGLVWLLNENVFQWKFGGQNGAVPGRGMNLEFPSQASHPLLDSEKPQALGLLDVEAPAVVLNGERQSVAFLLYANAHGGGVGMAGAIMQRLLNYAVDAGFVFIGQTIRYALGG